MIQGWSALSCTYFHETCGRIALPALSAVGFVRMESAPGEARFWRNEEFIYIGYSLETAPHYSPTAGIGRLDRLADGAEWRNQIPLWFMVPDVNPDRSYREWTFSDVPELERTLGKILQRLVLPVAVPCLSDDHAKREIFRKFESYRKR